jgi:catechol 2,3-dioxygenase-like lactoylglutathione lyase family enzyme
VYFVVGDADELFEFHRANGVQIQDTIDDRRWGLRDYTIRDPDGYELSFGHYIYTMEEPIEIERVDVTVRLRNVYQRCSMIWPSTSG